MVAVSRPLLAGLRPALGAAVARCAVAAARPGAAARMTSIGRTRAEVTRPMSSRAARATCSPGPSPTARALRLEGLRAPDGAALRDLLERLPAPPWDVELADDDPALPLVRAEGFEPYARVAVMARPIQGLPRPEFVAGVDVADYRNELAGEFQELERAAMEGLAAFAEMGQPTGYESAEGFDVFLVARDAGGLRGFLQAAGVCLLYTSDAADE